jgi:hypothetical protein
LDEGRALRPNRPKNLRPLSAPYHNKRQMFLSTTKGRDTPKDTPARSVATMRLPVGDALYDRLQNLVSALDVTIGTRTVGNFGDVAPVAAQEFLQVIQSNGPYSLTLALQALPGTPEVAEHAYGYLALWSPPVRLTLVVYRDVENVRHRDCLAHNLLLGS